MNQQAEDAITAMLNCFPQTSQNYDVLLETLHRQCAGLSDQAIIDAADRFSAGDVVDQSKKFAPSGPEFVAEARRCDEMLALRSRPRIPPPKYIPGPLAPFQIKTEQARAAHAHLPILFENITFDEWRKMSASRQVPAGAVWVAALGTVYGPAPKSQSKAA